jgi:hypothetical protein
MIEVHLIRPDSIPQIWEKLEPFLQKAADTAIEYDTASDFYHNLVTGFSGLFVVVDGTETLGVIVFQRMHFPTINVCHVIALAGEKIGIWQDEGNSAVYNWAATNDCQLIRAFGRPGWKKFYKEQGWSMDKVIYTKPVEQNLH